jgi:hypothetical protein
MACSKILSGDLPELTEEIIQYFLHDYRTLYSCILVNRLWCRLAIPLLWENPFSFPNSTKNYHFIEVYLYKLNEDDKIKLNEYGINSISFPLSTLFNYPSFFKNLIICNISSSINYWKTGKMVKNVDFSLLIYKLLLKLFIENGANLRTFMSFRDCIYFKITLELLSQNPNFISNIKNLLFSSNKIPHFLEFLNSNCDSISFLEIYFSSCTENTKYFSQIINSQRDLRIIKFNNAKNFSLLQSLKNSNCSNTLNTIIFYYIDFKSAINTNFKEIFEQLNVLKFIHILRCYSLNFDFIQNIINVTKSFELKTLFLCEPLQLDLLQLLLQKFGYCLEDVGFSAFTFNGSERELITKYCTKIKSLDLVGLCCHPALDLIGLIQTLSHLSININDTGLSSILLLRLGQILPIKLDYLLMDLNIKKGDFEIFLKDSQNTFIEKLLIRNKEPNGYENILPYIKEYIMKKKKVKYLAVTCGILSIDSLKDDENEFKLHNIIVSNYADLRINYYNFTDEMI